MKFSKILFGLSLTSFLFAAEADAQTKRTKRADEAYSVVEFKKALDLYKDAYKRANDKKEKQYISYRMALCAKNIGDYRKAENYLKRTVKMRYEDPIALLELAQSQLALGKFDKAEENFKKYQKLVPGDKRAEQGLKSTDFARAQKANPTRYYLTNIKRVNTKYQDFSPAYAKKDYSSFLFTTAREGVVGNDIDYQTGGYFTDIYGTKLEKKKRKRSSRKKGKNAKKARRWEKAVSLGNMGSGKGEETINTRDAEGPISLTPKANIMFYAKSVFDKNQYEGRKIFTSKRKGGGWDEGTIVDIPVLNAENYDIIDFTHPAITPDGKRLYFVAKLKDSYGGTDIYYSEYDKRKKKWTTPKNLGPNVNTAFNEAFPTVHIDGTLYFASMGHVGMGGYDMFKSKMDENGNFQKAMNLEYPLNSTYDDFGIVFKGNTVEEGLMTSNRKGGRGSDDIYSFELLDVFFNIKGKVTEIEEGLPVKGAEITMESKDGVVGDIRTSDQGEFMVNPKFVEKGKEYVVTINAKGYEPFVKKISTKGLTVNDFEKTDKGYEYMFDNNISLIKKKEIIVPIVMPHVEYDFGKATLRNSAMQDLDALASVLKAHKELKVKLRSHTDHIGGEERNRELSQQRAQACVDYLVSKEISADRLVPVGMGESEPFTMKKDDGNLKAGTKLTEAFINTLSKKDQAKARQYNRRTDFGKANDPAKEAQDAKAKAEAEELGRY
ncbi:MAG: OmpA family protein [Flavobacteriales bacterium]|jgi:peptidoglycan-associated lipoprotein|nr:OmpA family protein [Flavobacteriales bacterium]